MGTVIGIFVVVIVIAVIAAITDYHAPHRKLIRDERERERKCQASLRDIGAIDPDIAAKMRAKWGRSRGALSDEEYWAAAEIASQPGHDGSAPNRYGNEGIHNKLRKWKEPHAD